MVTGARPATMARRQRQCTVTAGHSARERGRRGPAGSGAHPGDDGVAAEVGGGTSAMEWCPAVFGQCGQERGRRRRFERLRSNYLRGEEQHGEAELGAASAGFGVAGDGGTVRRPAEAGARARARVRVSAGARSRGRGEGEAGRRGCSTYRPRERGGTGNARAARPRRHGASGVPVRHSEEGELTGRAHCQTFKLFPVFRNCSRL